MCPHSCDDTKRDRSMELTGKYKHVPFSKTQPYVVGSARNLLTRTVCGKPMRGMWRKSAERGGVSRRERTVFGFIVNELYHSFTSLGRDGQGVLPLIVSSMGVSKNSPSCFTEKIQVS